LYELVSRLDRSRFEPFLIAPAASAFKDKFEKLGIPVHEMQTSVAMKWQNRKEIFRINAALIRFVVKEKIQLVHMNEEACLAESLLPFFLWLKIKRIPFIFHHRSAGIKFGALKRFIFLLGTVVCVSDRVRREFSEKRRSDMVTRPSETNVMTVYDGIDTEEFGKAPADPKVRSGLGLNGEFLIGYISAIDPRKRQEIFIEAAAQVLKEHPDAKFLIVGDVYDGTPAQVHYKEGVIKLAAALNIQNQVIFTGYRSDVPQILKNLDIFVMTSRSEGLGDVVIEAMAAGKPVVSTIDGGPAEIVEEGKSGYLIQDHGSAAAYAQRISQLLASEPLRRQMGEEGKIRAEKIFGIRRHVDSVQNLYERLLPS
jgi:glycosyltransferase involved in cell wall biosynthesis